MSFMQPGRRGLVPARPKMSRLASRAVRVLGAERLEDRLVMAAVSTAPMVARSIAIPALPPPGGEILPAPATYEVDLGKMAEDTTLRITKAQLLAHTGGVAADAVEVRNLAVSRGRGTLVSESDGSWTFRPSADWHGNVALSYQVVVTRPVEFRTVDGLDQADAFGDSRNGVAVFQDGVLVLTPAVRSQGGSLFLDDRFDLSRDFSASFRLNMSGGTGADGIAFVIHAADTGSRTLGGYGGGIGYYGIQRSVAVEFDTFINAEDTVQGHHVGINLDGAQRSEVSASPGFSLRHRDIHAWVDYSHAAGTLSVFVATTAAKPQVPLLSRPVALTERVGREAWFGFTAATGARTDRQVVKEWTLRAWQPRLGAPVVPVALAKLVVTPVNDPPRVAGPVNLGAMPEDRARRITPAQLLARSTDVDGDRLAVVNLAITHGRGTVTRSGDGSWLFRPAANWHGGVRFSYRVSDGLAAVSAAATLIVCPVNDAPTVSGVVDLGSIESGIVTRITSSQLLSRARDVDGDRLTVRQLRIVGGGGALTVNADGTWAVVAQVGAPTRITLEYQVSDGRLSTLARAVLTVLPSRQVTARLQSAGLAVAADRATTRG